MGSIRYSRVVSVNAALSKAFESKCAAPANVRIEAPTINGELPDVIEGADEGVSSQYEESIFHHKLANALQRTLSSSTAITEFKGTPVGSCDLEIITQKNEFEVEPIHSAPTLDERRPVKQVSSNDSAGIPRNLVQGIAPLGTHTQMLQPNPTYKAACVIDLSGGTAKMFNEKIKQRKQQYSDENYNDIAIPEIDSMTSFYRNVDVMESPAVEMANICRPPVRSHSMGALRATADVLHHPSETASAYDGPVVSGLTSYHSWPRSLTCFARWSRLFSVLWDEIVEQRMRRSFFSFQLFDSKFSTSFCSVFGLILLFLGILIFLLNRQAAEFSISYNIESGSFSRRFSLPKTFSGPVYVYYEMHGFFGNSRLYLRDSPQAISSEYSCTVVRTTKDAFDTRTVSGSLTLPTLAVDAGTNEEIIPDPDVFAYPCGLSSVSLFNDEFDFSSVDKESKETLPISMSYPEEISMWDWVQFFQPNSSFGGLQPWIFPHYHKYRIWLRNAATSSFRRLYGRINGDLEKGDYSINFKQNLWPSRAWEVDKAVTLISLSPIGSDNKFLAYGLIAVGLYFLFFGASLFVLSRYSFFFYSKSFMIAELPELSVIK